MVRVNEMDRLDAIFALGNDLDSSRRVQKVFELFARKPFIVDDQSSHGHKKVVAERSLAILSI
jgi:hypothetical protein